jgi:hypothetical protein
VRVYRAKVFIDATYEGDLMAKAGVSYAIGRESAEQYGESIAGVRYLDDKVAISPFDDEGKLLFGVMPGKPPVAWFCERGSDLLQRPPESYHRGGQSGPD